MYSAMTWLSMVEPPLSKGLTKVIGCGRAIHRQHETRPGQQDQMKHDMGQDQTKKDDMGKDEMKSKKAKKAKKDKNEEG